MQHLDDDIDLALDDPTPDDRPGPVFYLAAGLDALLLAGVFTAATAGRLTLDSRLLPLLITVAAILAAIAYAHRRPAN